LQAFLNNVFGDFHDLTLDDCAGLFQHLSRPFVKDFRSGLLKDIESSALDFPDLIIAENAKEYRTVFAERRLDHMTSLGLALFLYECGIIGQLRRKCMTQKGRAPFLGRVQQKQGCSDCLGS
jgi:hypothetical protein